MIGALFLVAAGIVAVKYKQMHAGSGHGGMIPPEFVDMVAAESVQWQPRSRLVGTVVAKRSVNLENEIVGVVTEVGFESGDTVEKGQILLKLDTSTEQADLAAAQATQSLATSGIEVANAEIRVAQSNLDLAKSNLRRYKSAATASSVAEADVDRAQAEVEKGLATLERAQSMLARSKAEQDQAAAKVKQIETMIAKKTLKSPFRARAGMHSTHPGQYLSEGTPIVTLTELTDDIYLDFAVPQDYAARVKPGVVVEAKSAMLGSDAAKITVVSIDGTVNPVTRNVRVRSSVPNPGYTLKPGMFIDVEVPVAPPAPFIAIPATAVRRAAYGDHVYVITPDPKPDNPAAMKSHQQLVKLGANLGDKVIVESGLKAGDLLAASGSFKLREGALVMRAPAGGPQGGAPANPAATPALDSPKASGSMPEAQAANAGK